MNIMSSFREVLVTCRSQTVSSVVITSIAAISIGLVLGTAGLSAAAQAKVLSTVDQVGTRSVAVYNKQMNTGLPSRILDSLERMDIVESAVGFGETTDVTNASFSGGKRVALRLVYGQLGRELLHRAQHTGVTHQSVEAGKPLIAFASEDAFDVLGIPSEGGGVRVIDEGIDVHIIGSMIMPEHLNKMTPTILAPVETIDHLSVIYLSAQSSEYVPLLAELVRSELRELSSEDYAIETSQAYATLRAAIDGELTASSHTMIISSLSAGAGGTMLVVWAVVLLRRKDLGRRRALGASRLMILGLMMGQVAVLTSCGSLLGTGVSSAILLYLAQPIPPLEFMSALVIALSSASTLLTILPALWAANRDPLSELRVP